ncbi:MAG: SBBP repeat-containing protein [Candidatus Levyibacteriota bacterium]
MVDRHREPGSALATALVAALLMGCANIVQADTVDDASARPSHIAASTAAPDAIRRQALAAYDRLPMLFEALDDDPVHGRRYLARGAGYQAAISARGALVALPFQAGTGKRMPDGSIATVVDLAFAGADGAASIRGVDPQPTRIHRLRGSAGTADRIDAATYARVAIDGLYPGIDAIFYGNGQRLEYDLIVAPGADPSRIRLQVGGIAGMELVDGGDLRIGTGRGAMTLQRPVAYQERAGVREPVVSSYVHDGPGTLRIEIGAYDTGRTLIIDPIVSYATYVGGTWSEQATAIAVDATGNAYIAGTTMSADFPIVSGYDRSLGKRSDMDAFVAKINPTGTALVYATYLGGPGGNERALGIAVDAAGSAYVTGTTSGSDFPVTANAYQAGTTGGASFVAKLAPSGNALAYSTYVWGATAASIAVDAGGNALVVGTGSSAFATTADALRPVLPPDTFTTGFVLKLDPNGSAPVYATFLGGSGAGGANAIAVDGQGNAYVAGWTTSPDFPTVAALQPSPHGMKDGFVAKLDPSGSRLIYSTYLGGSLDDTVNALAVDTTGHAYVAGETYSSDFPSLNGFQPRKSGYRLVNSSLGNAFVAKVDATGGALEYSSFLGGEVCTSYCQSLFGVPQFTGDAAYGIAVDGTGHAFVTGLATSYTFPLVDSTSPRKTQDNEDSAFVAKVSASGGQLLFSTFIRTGYSELVDGALRFPNGSATGVATDASGAAYVTGDAELSGNFQTTAGAFQTANAGGQDALVMKFAPPRYALSLATSSPYADTQVGPTLTATVSGPAASGSVALLSGSTVVGYAPIDANRAVFNLKLPVGIHSLSALLATPGSYADSAVLRQVVDNPLACSQ